MRVFIALAIVVLLPTAAIAESCRAHVGRKAAQEYVDQCLEVSPATHPPCNMANDCDLIISEIKRSCELLDGDASRPDFCDNY